MSIVLAIMIGLFLSDLLFDSYSTETVMSSKYNVYVLQYGIYTNLEVLNSNLKKLNYRYVVVNNDNKYYVYLGFFTNYENALKVSKILEDNEVYTFLKTDYYNDEDLLTKLNQIDQKISLTDKVKEIITYVEEGIEVYRAPN